MGITRKKKVCSSCNTEQFIFSRSRCELCASREDKKPAKTKPYFLKRTPLKQSTVPIKKQTDKNKEYRKTQSAIRTKFFNWHLERCQFSEEDGSIIYNPGRENICHLWYKRTYKSVQANINNCVYLQHVQHTRFDQLLDCNDFEALEREFICWPVVVERMKSLLPLIAESGKLKILFEQYLQNNNLR